MIDGVKIKELKVWQDKPDLEQENVKPGIFTEVLRNSEGLIKNFAQTNFSIAYKGTIKAFHWHKNQDDLWFIASGSAAIVLYDQRKGSSTFGETQVIEAGENNYKLVLIPVGVAHGYKVLSDDPCLLFYHVTKEYDRENPDEERIDPFDKKINFNWDSLKEE
ncbi:MAG: dTDP-4-dehydrorhamnose 3,5-epimerase family protein [Patescibacteria group bacterium]|nr:dTDP-4-dehydrorhamnose 3,5-epimerase family protein [Patescibacteria group bacterium]